MASKDIKNPPVLKKTQTYEQWKKELKLWQQFSALSARKQALALFLSQEGKDREVVLGLNIYVIDADDGINRIIVQLDKLNHKHKLGMAYTAYDEFDGFKRSPDVSNADFTVEGYTTKLRIMR